MFRQLTDHLQTLIIQIQTYKCINIYSLDLYYEGLKMTRLWSKHVAPIL